MELMLLHPPPVLRVAGATALAQSRLSLRRWSEGKGQGLEKRQMAGTGLRLGCGEGLCEEVNIHRAT